MSKIKISALGGQGENGKNMFIIEIDDRIFILDAGLKYPEIDMYGIDAVIPDITYLKEHKEQIEGIFVSHGHEDHIGALPYLLENINARVYSTHFTICMIESLLQENNMDISKYKLYRINDNKTLKFGEVNVSFFNTTHSIPESVGIVITTKDGNIVYAPDFNFGMVKDKKYSTSFDKIIELTKTGVLAVLSESIGITDVDRSNNDLIFEHNFQQYLDNTHHRIFVSAFSSDLGRIQKIIDMSIAKGKKIAIMGRKGEEVIDIAIKAGYLKIPESQTYVLKPYDDNNTNDLENLIILVSGIRNEPYYSFIRMCNGKDRYIRLNNQDKVVFVSDPVPGTEKLSIETMDLLYRQDLEVSMIPKKLLRTSHATSEDLYLLYSMLKPKYFYPIIGEYRHLYRHKKLLKDFGYSENNIIMLENGLVSVIENGELSGYEKNSIGDIYVDGTLIGNVSGALVSEREQLAEEGAVIIIAYLDTKRRQMLGEPVITTKGFVYNTDQDAFNKTITEFFKRMMKNALNKEKLDLKSLKVLLSEEVGKNIFRLSKKRPSVLPILIELKK